MQNVSSRCGKSDNAPRLRFPEFSGEWAEKKLGEISERVTRKNKNNETDLPLTISSKDGLVDQITYFNKTVASKDMSGYYLLKNGEFAYNKSYSVGYDFGSVKRLDKYPMGALSTLYICFSIKNFDSDFMKVYFDSLKWYREIYLIAAEGARNHGLLNISTEDFFETRHKLPLDIPEQKKIAAFFTLLDRRIQKQRQLVECLKTYKRGVSEAIFERKFGFPNKTKWKKIKIENLFSERCERAIGNEELLAVTINGGIQKRNEIQLKDNSSEDKSNYKRVHIGDIAYNTMRMWQGASGVSCYDGIVSPAYTVIVLKDKENQCIDFWGHYFKHTNLIRTFQKFSQGLTSDTWNLKYTQLSQINLYVPEYKEQCMIANFLHKFDNKISIEGKKLFQLSMLKNELLHRMFI